MHFLDNPSKKITNATDVAMSNNDLLMKYHTALMAQYGIFFLPLKMGTFSDSHDENDVKKLLSATRSIVSSGVLSKSSYHD